MRKNRESFKQSILALMISQIMVKILGLAYKLFITNKKEFGDEGNAICSASFQVYALILSVTAIGIPSSIARLVAERSSQGDHYTAHKILKLALLIFGTIGMLGSYFLCFYSKQIANGYLKIKESELSIIALSPSIFIVTIISVFKGYFNGRECIRVTAKAQSADQLTKTISAIVLIQCISILASNKDTTVLAAVACFATTTGNIIELMTLITFYIKERKNIELEIINSINKKRIKTKNIITEIIRVALPISITALLGTLAKNIDSIMIISELKGIIGYENAKIQYGILSGKVETLVNFPLSFTMAINIALLPRIATSKDNIIDKEEKINKAILYEMIIAIPVFIVFQIYGKEILGILFPNATTGNEILKISSISIIFVAAEQTIDGILYAIGKAKVTIVSVICGIAVKAIINSILIKNTNPTYGGVNGAAIGTVCYNIITFLISMIALKKYTNLKISNSIKYAILSIIGICIIKIINIILKINGETNKILSIIIGIIVCSFIVLTINKLKLRHNKMTKNGSK